MVDTHTRMQTPIEKNLADLKEKLLAMASHAEIAVKNAVEALTTRDEDLAQSVKENDVVIDRFEVEVDEMAIHLLAKAPLASDLRLITVAMKISQNLERVGDEASKIAKRARDLSQEPPLKLFVDIPRMASLALEMLKSALDAFVNHDPATARAVIPLDKEADALNKQIYEELAGQILELMPSMAKVRLVRQWAGLCDMTPDFSPVMGRTPVGGFLVDVGWGTYGFKAGPVSGEAMAELIATERTPDLIAPFALARFAEGQLVGEKGAASVGH